MSIRSPDLIPTRQAVAEPPQLYLPETKNRFPVSTTTIVIATVIIVAVIIGLTFWFVTRIEAEVTESTVDPDTLNLSTLVDLDVDGECCVEPSQVIGNPRWIFSPSNNFTYSFDQTDPLVVCQGLGVLETETCINFVTDDNGDPKILAHKGIISYFAFSVGDAGAICDSYTPC